MILWLIGLSGAGKTVIGKEVYSLLREKGSSVAYLDGDILREIMGNDLGYTELDRIKNAWRMAKLCAYLEGQGVDVICAILSIVPESREWLRKNTKRFFEVYIKVPIDVLVSRDTKDLYAKALRGEIQNVVGVDINFPEPTAPDLIIENAEPKTSFREIANQIIDTVTR